MGVPPRDPDAVAASLDGAAGAAVVDEAIGDAIPGAVGGFPKRLPPPNKPLPGVDEDEGVVALPAGFGAPNNPVVGAVEEDPGNINQSSFRKGSQIAHLMVHLVD